MIREIKKNLMTIFQSILKSLFLDHSLIFRAKEIQLSKKTSYGFLTQCQNKEKTNDPVQHSISNKSPKEERKNESSKLSK